MTRKKKMVLNITVCLLVFLFICTLISKTIYSMLLPEVQTCLIADGSISSIANIVGTYEKTDKTQLIASSDWKVLEVIAENEKPILQGEPLFKINVSEALLETEQLQLAVLKLENQLIPDSSSEGEDERIQKAKELDVAKHELAIFISESEDKAAMEQKKLELEVELLENKLKYDTITGYVREEVELQLILARDTLSNFLLNNPLNMTLEKEKLELAIIKLETEIVKDEPLTEKKKSELKSEIAVASLELKQQKASYPQDGNVLSKYAGKLTDFKVKPGDTLEAKQVFGYILPDVAKDCVKWEMELTDGYLYDVGHEVIVAAEIKEKGVNTSKEKIVSTNQAATVFKKELTEEKDKWNFYATFDKEVVPSSTAAPKVTLVQSSQSYRMRVPLSCVVPAENKQRAVHALKKRQGLFSEETVVNEIIVTVLDENSLFAAIESKDIYNDIELVKYASKSISDGSVVNVVK